jgi:hypothetical protein
MTSAPKLLGFAALAAISILWPNQGRAVPAFARQTGASCSACHFQHFPGLTAYGRIFKSSGYTLAGAQGMIEGKLLSLSRVLNASVVTKIRYIKTNGTSGAGSDVGEFQFPDEAAIWLGGRVGSTVGFVLEAQLTDPDAPIFASFKMPIGFQFPFGRFSAIPFSTDGLGAPFGFELLNTGAVRNTRMLEERNAFSAAQYVVAGGEEGKAEGIALVFSNQDAFLNVTPWTPNHGSVALDRPAWYLRGGVTPRIGGFEVGLGVQYWAGTAQTLNQRTRAWGGDLQIQGHAGKWPVGLYAGYARAPGSETAREVFLNPEPRLPAGITGVTAAGTVLIAPPANFFNPEPFAEEAASVLVEFGVIPGRVTAAAAYRLGDNGKATMNEDVAGTFGATYLLAQNIQLQVNHVIFGGNARSGTTGNQKTIVMIFAAF